MRTTSVILLTAALLTTCLPASPDHEWRRVDVKAESPHPYPDDNDLQDGELQPLRLRIAGAQAYQIHFAAIDLEPDYDYIEIYGMNPRGELQLVQRITGAYHELVSKVVTGPEAWVVIQSDSSSAGFGYVIDWVQIQVAKKAVPVRPGPRHVDPTPVDPYGDYEPEDEGEDSGPGEPPGGPPGRGPGGRPAGGGYLQVLAHVEMLFGVEGNLYALPEALSMAVGEQYLVVIHGLDQLGRPMPVLTSIRSEGFKGNATLRPDSQDTYALDAGHHVANAAMIQIRFPQNPAFDRIVQIKVRPRFEFTYRDGARKVSLSIYTGVHRPEAAQVNLYYTTDPSNLTGGEDVTALVRGKTGPHSTFFLEADHVYPLQRGLGFFTMVLRKTDGSEVRQTYSIEYKQANPTPVGD